MEFYVAPCFHSIVAAHALTYGGKGIKRDGPGGSLVDAVAQIHNMDRAGFDGEAQFCVHPSQGVIRFSMADGATEVVTGAGDIADKQIQSCLHNPIKPMPQAAALLPLLRWCREQGLCTRSTGTIDAPGRPRKHTPRPSRHHPLRPHRSTPLLPHPTTRAGVRAEPQPGLRRIAQGCVP